MNKDEDGNIAKWVEWIQIIGKIITGITALTSSILVLASGVAGIGMLIIGGLTFASGLLTLNNGVADVVENMTGFNYMSDGFFQQNKTAYKIYSNIVEVTAAVGSIICGGWLKYNAPRISAYKGIANFNYTNTNLETKHMLRPWQNSLLFQQNVIRYGKMARDGIGWSFEAAGYFNGKAKTWRLIVDITHGAIWHWGPF